MSFLTELAAQLKTIWGSWSQWQRLSIVSALVLSLASIAGVGYWAMTPHYVVLADHLTPTQTANYVSALESAGIGYKLNFAGSSISVSQSQHSQARLEVRELIDETPEGEAELVGSLWSDPMLNQTRLLRQQELRLARTIQQMKPVRAATVHLTRSESSPFIREQKPAKASVTLSLKPGVAFSSRDTTAIVSLIAHSVENLQAENVTVLSTDGRLLSSPNDMDGEISGQLDFRTQLETNLAAKAETLLVPLLGVGNAMVRVNAEIDFTATERKQRTIDPDSKAKVKEELHKTSISGSSPIAKGPPGTAANVSVPPDAGSRSGNHETEDLTTEYVNGETNDLIRELPGRILRLTIAAVVQLPEVGNESADGLQVAGGPEGNAGVTPGNPPAKSVSKQEIEAIIRNAVGFDSIRGDEIEVVAAKLAVMEELVPTQGFLPILIDALPVIKALSLGMAALVALILGTLTLRRLRPVVISSEQQGTLSPEMIERLNELSNQMQENPEVVNTVLATWLKSGTAPENTQRRAA